MNFTEPLVEDVYYHIYNRGNNGQTLFCKPDNYRYFLEKYYSYLGEYLDTYSYCLLPNHFHLMVKIKPYGAFPADERLAKFPKLGKSPPPFPDELRCSEQFRKFLMGYAKAINKQEVRTGSLFENAFKRKEVRGIKYLTQLIFYIHANPQKHGISSDFKKYQYSSYQSFLSDSPSRLKKQEVFDWFGDMEAFVKFHEETEVSLSGDQFDIVD